MAPLISDSSLGFKVGVNDVKSFYLGGSLIWSPGSSLPSIGDAYAGGYVGSFISATGTGTATHMLIVAPKSGGQISAGQWKTSNTADANPPSRNEVDGSLATQQFNTATHPCFQWADGLSIGGFTDWYIPSIYEFLAIYRNLKPSTASNSTTGYTQNTNPIGITGQTAAFTASVPARTTVALFQSGGAQAFDSSFPANQYYTSLQSAGSGDGFFRMDFNTGGSAALLKTSSQGSWRAIRRVSL